MRLATLLFCVSSIGFAGTWSGYLVDSGCWANRQTNVSSDATSASREMNADVRYCSPTDDTKKFAVVLRDWQRLKLDPAGNTRAYQLVRHTGKRHWYVVSVSGALSNKKTIKVGSISAALSGPRR